MAQFFGFRHREPGSVTGLNAIARRQTAHALFSLGGAMLAGRGSPALPAGRRLIFTVTNGRTGSDMLHRLFGAFAGVCARHEPAPDFRRLRALAARYPALARSWLRHVKLPAISACDGDIYVETSHMFCKGYLEPMLDLGVRFDLVFLTRPAAEVARSMARLTAIPGAGPWAGCYYTAPDDDNFAPLSDTRGLNAYQLCYWHALEVEARQHHYAALARANGLRVAHIETRALSDRAAVLGLFEDLEMDMSRLSADALTRCLGQRANQKLDRKKTLPADPDRIARDEAEIHARLLPRFGAPAAFA